MTVVLADAHAGPVLQHATICAGESAQEIIAHRIALGGGVRGGCDYGFVNRRIDHWNGWFWLGHWYIRQSENQGDRCKSPNKPHLRAI